MATEPLSQALNTNLGGPAYKQYMSSQKPIFEEKQRLSKELGGVEQTILEGQQRKKEIEAEGKVAAGEEFVKRRGEAEQQMKEGLAAAPIEPFIPTKDTAEDLAGLFSLIGVIGMVVGKGNAQQAMGAMNGMLEGHRKGRADLYKQERDTYEKNFKSLIKKHEELRTEFKDAVETYARDKELGEQKAMLAAAKSESSILQAMVRKGQIVDAGKLVDDVGKSIGKAVEIDVRDKQHAQTLSAAKERAQMQIDAANEREDARARAKLISDTLKRNAPAKEQKTVQLKPGGEIQKGYVADNQLRADVEDIISDLKKNPKLVQDLKKYRMEAFLTEEGKVLNQVVNEDIPADLRKFLTKVRDVRNNYYLNISGKAVTGGEALRSYGTVPQPGDSPEAMIDKLSGMYGRINQAIDLKRQMYPALPELKVTPGRPTGLSANENLGVGSGQTYQVNQIIEKDNKRYRVIDASDPTDPEVEEIE
jgi:hypothetical protein